MIRGPVSSVVEGCVMSLMPTRSWSGFSFTLSLILYTKADAAVFAVSVVVSAFEGRYFFVGHLP